MKAIDVEDIDALIKIIDLIQEFLDKNPIRRKEINLSKITQSLELLKSSDDKQSQKKVFKNNLKKLISLIKKDLHIDLYFIVGAHGGVIIEDIGYCEFDSPRFAVDTLIKRMKLAKQTNMPYNIEIAICCLEWLSQNYFDKLTEFQEILKNSKMEIINPSYSQPYNLIIGPESNIKQFEYGIKILNKLGLKSDIYYCSESSIHPQIPQILKLFGINYGSLRTRLLGVSPTAPSAYIGWVGLDNTNIDALIDISGVFNGEYWHGAFFKEIPNLSFQAIARPFIKYILYSSLEDFIMPLPYHEDFWRVSNYTDVFGTFVSCSEIFSKINKDGEWKYKRDDFQLGDYIFFTPNLQMNNKTAEIHLKLAEFINYFLELYVNENNDDFLDELWKKLLLAQAHDAYAVPFIRPGDYSRTQLSRDIIKNLTFSEDSRSILEISIDLLQEVQKKCREFINTSLSTLIETFGKPANNFSKKVLILNPNPYNIRDIVSINQESILGNIILSGYSYCIKEIGEIEKNAILNDFDYKVTLINRLTILIEYKGEKVYYLKFKSKQYEQLEIIEEYSGSFKKSYVFSTNNKERIEIIEYSGINRLEFILDISFLKEVVVIPQIVITTVMVNYPFGIEQTKRTKIQSLDFLWSIGTHQGIIFIQKNSQQFIIDHENGVFSNLFHGKGRFEFSISITKEEDSPDMYVSPYFQKVISIPFENQLYYQNTEEKILIIDPQIQIINLWHRSNRNYLRALNSNNATECIDLSGKGIPDRIKEINLRYEEIKNIPNRRIPILPWKIKTFQW